MAPAREAAPPWQVLIGPFDAEHIEAELDHGGPVLLVPNNPELSVERARQFQDRRDGLLYVCRELVGSEDREVCWYRYNDPRFDGVSPPEPLRARAANLRLRDLALRRVMRLDSLIHGWANQDPSLAQLVSGGGGRVWALSKLPVPIVAGLSRVEEVIGEFCWTPLGGLLEGEEPGEAAGEVETVARWLQGSCFHAAERRRVDAHAAAPSLVWRQDPLRLETRRRERLQGDLERLEAEKQALAEERRRLAEERHSLAEALAAAVAAREASLAEAGALAAEVEALQGQVTSLVAEVRAAALAARQEPRRGDLRLCTDPADPRCGTLLMLLSAPGEPERWESAVSRS